MAESEAELKMQGYTMADEAIPVPGAPVILVTRKTRCIGFLDQSFNWRYARDHGLVRDVIAWADLSAFVNPE
jgi:hypothetical protein